MVANDGYPNLFGQKCVTHSIEVSTEVFVTVLCGNGGVEDPCAVVSIVLVDLLVC